MKTIKCIDCNENLMKIGLIDYCASIYLRDFNQETNKFENLSVCFNPFCGWICGCCDNEITDDGTFNALQKYLPTDEDLKNLDFNLLSCNSNAYINRECPRCKDDSDNKEEADITKDGIEFIGKVILKFNPNSNKFEISSIDNSMNNPATCYNCGKELLRDTDKSKFDNPIEIPFF